MYFQYREYEFQSLANLHYEYNCIVHTNWLELLNIAQMTSTTHV